MLFAFYNIMNYNEQIKSPKWQKKRLEILNLHKFTCEVCGDKETQLHVHHSRYIKGRKIYEYDNDILMCVCEKCHSEIHNKTDKKEEIIYPKEIIQFANLLLENFDDEQINQFYHFILAIVEYKYSRFEIMEFLPQIYISDGEFESFKNYCITRNEIIEIKEAINNLEHKF